MQKRKVLFISHPKKQCGVYEFGRHLFHAIAGSNSSEFVWLECNSLQQLHQNIDDHRPSVIIYNYHPATMPWLSTKVAPRLYKNNVHEIPVLQIGIIHEITQQIADNATGYRKPFLVGDSTKLLNVLFDFYVAADPTLLLRNPRVYKTGRLIPSYKNLFPEPAIPTIGSFGFGTPKKGFEKIVERVQEEFDEAIIRLNIPSADFGDADGSSARLIADNCRRILTKKNIDLQVTHDFLEDKALLDFLAQSSINVFLYEDTAGRGLSSAVDNALAVSRPIAVSNSSMFRHVLQAAPSVCLEKSNLKTIISAGFPPLENVVAKWDQGHLQWEFDRIIDSAISKFANKTAPKMGVVRTVQSYWRRAFSLPDKSFTWLRNTEAATEDDLTVNTSATYQPIQLPEGASLNRILDNAARATYAPAITKLIELVPKTMGKKIAEANVQQGFVFDTVCRYLPSYPEAKILCVGSYEDTASMGLIKMGYEVEEIDPMINYYLQEYFTRPSTCHNSYNIIFSTSVIEHDPDDESFVKCINDLLAPGGVGIITCDYKDGWKPGDLKPEVDARFYTHADLKKRLLQHMPDCKLVDTPQWDCPNPDFHYLGKYIYTFASFVVKKEIN